MGSILQNDPIEKLLLRKAKNNDLRRSAQWLANIAYSAMVKDSSFSENQKDTMVEALDYYGSYTETEDPRELLVVESELSRLFALPRSTEEQAKI